MGTCCTRCSLSGVCSKCLLTTYVVSSAAAVDTVCSSRSISQDRQFGCGYEPLAEKTLAIGLTRGSVARESVEQMTVILDLASIYIL